MNKKEFLMNAFKYMKAKIGDIKIVNLSSIDGYPICCSNFINKSKVDEENLSAVASSITALSLAASTQLIESKYRSTTIETEDGLVLLIQAKFLSKECILCIITGDNHNIGRIRYFALKLANMIETAKLSAD